MLTVASVEYAVSPIGSFFALTILTEEASNTGKNWDSTEVMRFTNGLKSKDILYKIISYFASTAMEQRV